MRHKTWELLSLSLSKSFLDPVYLYRDRKLVCLCFLLFRGKVHPLWRKTILVPFGSSVNYLSVYHIHGRIYFCKSSLMNEETYYQTMNTKRGPVMKQQTPHGDLASFISVYHIHGRINLFCKSSLMDEETVTMRTIVTFKRYLIIDDKSLPHKQRRSFTQLLISKIKFSSEPPTRWLTGSAEMTPVIGNAQGVRGEVTLTIELVD